MGRRDVIVIKPLFPVMSYILNIMVLISDSDIKINYGAEKLPIQKCRGLE